MRHLLVQNIRVTHFGTQATSVRRADAPLEGSRPRCKFLAQKTHEILPKWTASIQESGKLRWAPASRNQLHVFSTKVSRNPQFGHSQ